jgi:hypothetical protein
LSSELLRYTEEYSNSETDDDTATGTNQSLLSSSLILDFTKDLNIRDVQFVDVYEDYKRVLNKLAKFNCLDCTKFKKHVHL